jgi:hypothetical protein
MDSIKIEGWMTTPGIAEVRLFVGEIIHVCVGGETRATGTPWSEFFRFARVRSVRARTDIDRTCPHCGEPAQIAFEVVWESEFRNAKATEVCEICNDGRVTEGGDSLRFGE